MNYQNKIILISGVLIVSIIGLLITIVLGFGLSKEKEPEVVDNKETIVAEYPILDPDVLFEDQKEPANDDLAQQYESITGSTSEELTEDIAKIIKSNTYSRIYSMNFEEALAYLTNEIEKYSISENPEDFKPLDDLLRELSKMAQIHYAIDSGDEAMAIEIIGSLEQPSNHLLATLSLERVLRESVIRNEDSLNPIFESEVTFEAPIIVNTYDIRTSYDILEVAKIPFQTDGNRLIADYLYTTDGLILYKIYEEVEGTTNYMTIKRWRELMPKDSNSADDALNEIPVITNEEVENEN